MTPDSEFPRLWLQVNRVCLAKSLSELAFEEALPAHESAPGTWCFPIADGLAYLAQGQRHAWGSLTLDAATLRRVEHGVDVAATDAAGFFCDARERLAMSGATLATYLHELRNTLLSDVELAWRNRDMTAAALLAMTDDRLQSYLGGHPKAPASKGRLGWGLEEQRQFAPEHGGAFQLSWLAITRSACLQSYGDGVEESALLADMMDPDERDAVMSDLRAAGGDPATHLLLPAHPWQWQHMIRPHYAEMLADGRMLSLGMRGAEYRPLISLRTLSHAGRAARWDVKLPVTILNTSAYRGLPPQAVVDAPLLADWLAERIGADATLAGMRLVLLRDAAGIAVPHPLLHTAEAVPYRFREMLGAAWRQRVDSILRPGETAMMVGALAHLGCDGVPLISACIRASRLTPRDWLQRMFTAVVVPLYHLLCRYGAGFIAHGQNVTLLLRNFAPVGVAIKDLHGDFDLLEGPLPEHADLPAGVRDRVGRRPAAHLIHHLQTGHFVSVLRFVSEALARHDAYPEQSFYSDLGDVLQRYMQAHPELDERFRLFDLFTPTIPRICINRARFRVGYSDDATRPRPETGTALSNPLAPIRQHSPHRASAEHAT